MKTTTWVGIVIIGCILVIAGTFGMMIKGKVVPPGTTVIVLHAKGPATIKHEGSYVAWGRDKVYFVDTKLRGYSTGVMKVLCADEINMDVNIKWLGSFKVSDTTIDTIKKKVPAIPIDTGDIRGFQLSLDNFFDTAMRDILISLSKAHISTYKTDGINTERERIRNVVKAKFLKQMKDLKYPISTSDILLLNLDFPNEVTDSRKAIKKAELSDLENAAIALARVSAAKRNAEIALEEGKVQLVKAKADAAANRVRSSSLTPAILMVKQIEAIVSLANGPNNTAIVMPYSAIKPGGMQNMILNRAAIEKLTK